MISTEGSTAEWLKKELAFICSARAGELNAKLAPAFVSCDEETQEATFRFPVGEWAINGLGTLHGGITYTMMDLAMSIVIYCYTRKSIPPTITMTVNYQRPVPRDGDVLIRARLQSAGKRNATAYCEALLPDSGKIAASAIGTYAVIEPRK